MAPTSDAAPPALDGAFISGNLMDFHQNPVELMTRAAKLGDVVRLRFLHMKAYQLSHPDAIKATLLASGGAIVKGRAVEAFRPLVGRGVLLAEGEAHRKQRRMMQPAFHHHRVARYAEDMVREAQALSDRWEDGCHVDMAVEMHRLTLRIAAQTLFGADLDEADVEGVSEAVKAFAAYQNQQSHPMGPLLGRLPTAIGRRFQAGRAYLSDLVYRLIAARRAGGDTGDILSMLVFARDEDGDGAAMDDALIHDETVTLLVAGHETTAGTLLWAFYLLSQHPQAMDRLAAEVDAALGGRPPTMDDLPKLTWARAIFAEALRLYPPAVALPRQVAQPVEIGGHTLPEGALLLVSVWCAHRDPRWWEEPDAFRPERFLGDAGERRPKYAYVPFGGGPRICVGEAFAWMEGTLALATLAQRWRPELAPGHTVEMETTFTVRPRGGLPMVLHRR